MKIAGRTVYLGVWGSPESHQRYASIVAQRATGSPPAIEALPGTLTVAELCLRWLEVNRGLPSPATYRARAAAVTLLAETHPIVPCSQFTPSMLAEVRDALIARGLSRVTINKQVGYCRQVFRWGTRTGTVPASVLAGLNALDNLKRGETRASEPRRVSLPPRDLVVATMRLLPRVVRDMIRFALLTGARPG
jgi:hypothetical protein